MGSFYCTDKLHHCLLPLHQVGQHSLQKGTIPSRPINFQHFSPVPCNYVVFRVELHAHRMCLPLIQSASKLCYMCNMAILFCAQASTMLQLCHVSFMGIGLISLSLHFTEMIWLLTAQPWDTSWLFWRILLWAAYFGVLSHHSANKATTHLVRQNNLNVSC